MPGERAAQRCRCGSTDVFVQGTPPGPAALHCRACGASRAVCGAARRGGGVCLGVPLAGRYRCRMHGGNSKRGADHGQYRHGRRSRYAPANLGALIEEALADDGLLSMEEDLATIDAFVAEEMQSLAAETPAQLWKAAIEAAQEMADVDGDKAVAMVDKEAFDRLKSLLENGWGAKTGRDRIVGLLAEKARTARVEHERRKALGVLIDAAAVRALLLGVLADVREVVHDRAQRAEIGRLIAARAGALDSPGSHRGRALESAEPPGDA